MENWIWPRGITISQDVSVLLGNGDGTFQAKVDYGAGNGPVGLLATDFNGDGRLDLAVPNFNSNNISILLGNSDGTFATAVNYPLGDQPQYAVAADFDGDGKLDLAVTGYNGSNLVILLGNGDGTFRAPVTFSVGTHPIVPAVADFNGDGKPDLAVTNYDSNTFSVLLNTTTFSPSGQVYDGRLITGRGRTPTWLLPAILTGTVILTWRFPIGLRQTFLFCWVKRTGPFWRLLITR